MSKLFWLPSVSISSWPRARSASLCVARRSFWVSWCQVMACTLCCLRSSGCCKCRHLSYGGGSTRATQTVSSEALALLGTGRTTTSMRICIAPPAPLPLPPLDKLASQHALEDEGTTLPDHHLVTAQIMRNWMQHQAIADKPPSSRCAELEHLHRSQPVDAISRTEEGDQH